MRGSVTPKPKTRCVPSDEGPGGAVPVVGQWEAALDQRLRAADDGGDLVGIEERAEAGPERARAELGDDAAHVVGRLRGEALAGEVPDDGAQLPVLVERQPVV